MNDFQETFLIKEKIRGKIRKLKQSIALKTVYSELDEILSFSHTEDKQKKINELRGWIKTIEDNPEWEEELKL